MSRLFCVSSFGRLGPVAGLLLASLVGGHGGASSALAQSTGAADSAPENTLVAVDSLRRAGAFQAAQKRLQALRQHAPDRVAVLWRLAYTYADIGQSTEDEDVRTQYYENALAVAEAGLATDSTSARAHLAMAVAQGRAALDAGTRERIERSRAVKRHADRALAIDSTLDGAYHTRGRWHREVEDIGFFQRALVKTVYGGLPESSIDQAVRDFQRALELHDRILHHLELGKTYLQMDRPDAARRELQAVLDRPVEEPFDPDYKDEARRLLEDL
ncbi:tetratricopeptide repeat protein [Salinibacter altiplanensis]|uniref:tetratricopeptide repeat protein n=1 Tax=Salinibacter altiplanensis TaxID=1803181 RepID=UPI000C9F67C8|nr:hypothetical protein [Salinibacter altiplanensis]